MLSNRLYCLLVLSLVSISIFAQKKGTLKTVNKVVLTEEALRQKAIKLAQGQVMVDGHVGQNGRCISTNSYGRF
jgi:hypothetical protein